MNELEVMSQFFKTEVIPYTYDGNALSRLISFPNVFVEKPLFENNSRRLRRADFRRVFFSRDCFFFLKEFIFNRAFLSKEKTISFLSDSVRMLELVEHPVIKRIIETHKREDVFYFFWGRGSYLFVPLLRKKIKAKIFLRLHGYDLYESRQNNYIPFRRQILKAVDFILPISKNGSDYLISKYPAFKNKIIINRLGTLNKGRSISSEDGVLRIFSCSSLISLKRVTLLAHALRLLTFPVEWTHIGDGPLKNELLEVTSRFPVYIRFTLTGWKKPDEVFYFYSNSCCDLFINVSETEGLPVSIMEAFAASIPVYATNVGGVSEIVNDTNGKLLSSEISSDVLATIIADFNTLSYQEKKKMRESAFETFRRDYDAFKNANALVSLFQDCAS
ncbi:MAG TPA: glycosyltransferase [Cyclobacteriaceae bacterium]|nr:glycosyltransferase [Cyclobacteriaceae bacterium]